MATLLTIPLKISVAKVSQYLSIVDIAKQKIFKGGAIDGSLPTKIYSVRKGVEWKYNTNPNDTTLANTSNYLYALCGKYAGTALQIVQQNNGGIIINPVTGQPMTWAFYRKDFTIGDAGSLMNDGDMVLTIFLSNFLQNSVEMFPSGSLLTIGDSTQFSINSVVYTTASVTITLNQAVGTGQRYTITGLRAVAGNAASSSDTSAIPLPLLKGKVLSNDGAGTLYWTDPFIEISSANFQPDGKTYLSTDLADNDLAIFWMDAGVWLKPESPYNEFTRIIDGGMIINIAEFDANNNSYQLKIFKKGLA